MSEEANCLWSPLLIHLPCWPLSLPRQMCQENVSAMSLPEKKKGKVHVHFNDVMLAVDRASFIFSSLQIGAWRPLQVRVLSSRHVHYFKQFSFSQCNAHAQYRNLVLIVVLILQSGGHYLLQSTHSEWKLQCPFQSSNKLEGWREGIVLAFPILSLSVWLFVWLKWVARMSWRWLSSPHVKQVKRVIHILGLDHG